MTIDQKKEALNNALISFNFPSKYFIYSANKGRTAVFTVATILDGRTRIMDTKTKFMSYDEMNTYLKGYYDGKMNKF